VIQVTDVVGKIEIVLVHDLNAQDRLHWQSMSLRGDRFRRSTQYRANAGVLLSLVCVLVPAAGACGPVEQGMMAQTGLRYWEWRGEGALLRLTQRLPDQTRAFFLGRGFGAEDADHIARRCVFQTMFKNIAPRGTEALEFDLEQWRVHSAEDTGVLLTREHWARLWEKRDVPRAARIAFEWSLLPTRQRYQPGDFNWGMTSYGLEPGSRFDLDFFWSRDGVHHRGRIEGVECPADVHPEPGS
jgi:hypothetical protein